MGNIQHSVMKVFISYASSDLNLFRIPDMATRLENTEKIERVFYWDRDSTAQKSIVKYMEESITVSDVILIVCSDDSNNSGPVQQETDMAVYLNKRIVPIFLDINDVRISLRPKRGVKYYKDDFDSFFKDLFMVVTELLPEIPQEEEFADFHGFPLVINEYRAMKSLEEQLNIIIPPIQAITLPDRINLSRLSFRLSFGFATHNQHVTQLNLVKDVTFKYFPESVGLLTNLRILILHQEIEMLPELIGNLKNLRYLDLRQNRFGNLPQALSKLTNLRVLLLDSMVSKGSQYWPFRFFSNQMQTITPEIFEVLQPLLESRCKLDRKCIDSRRKETSYNQHSPFYCAECGETINHQEFGVDRNGNSCCPVCQSKRFYVFRIKENINESISKR